MKRKKKKGNKSFKCFAPLSSPAKGSSMRPWAWGLSTSGVGLTYHSIFPRTGPTSIPSLHHAHLCFNYYLLYLIIFQTLQWQHGSFQYIVLGVAIQKEKKKVYLNNSIHWTFFLCKNRSEKNPKIRNIGEPCLLVRHSRLVNPRDWKCRVIVLFFLVCWENETIWKWIYKKLKNK